MTAVEDAATSVRPSWTPTPGKVLALRTCTETAGGMLTGYSDFVWPSDPGAVVEAPDWDPKPCCGKGLHGLLWGTGDPGYLNRGHARYMVVEVDETDIVWVGHDKVKFPRCTVVYVGDLQAAAALITEHAPSTVDQREQVAALSRLQHRTFVLDPCRRREECPAGCGGYDCEHVAPEECVEVPPGPISNVISSQIDPTVVAEHRRVPRIPMDQLRPTDWGAIHHDLPDYDEPLHTVALDLDVNARLVPSSTRGHSHLYIDVPMPWSKYERLLEALADCGVIEPGYLSASKKREATHLRLPWIKKPTAEEEQQV